MPTSPLLLEWLDATFATPPQARVIVTPKHCIGHYYQRYVRDMRKAARALEDGDIKRANYWTLTALSWRRVSMRRIAA